MLRRYSLLIPVVPALLFLNGVIFLLQMYSNDSQLIYTLGLWPPAASSTGFLVQNAPHFQIWQLLTYGFLHGGVMHLFLNMYALWLFGSRMESAWGSRVFAFYYFVCIIGAGVVQLIVASQSGEIYPTIGASGGVFGLLLAFAMTYPNERLMLIFPPVLLKAKWFVLIYGLIELYFGVTGSLAGVAHFAHLGGMLFGFLLLRYWRRHPPRYL